MGEGLGGVGRGWEEWMCAYDSDGAWDYKDGVHFAVVLCLWIKTAWRRAWACT